MGISNVGPFLILADHFKFSLRKVGQENDSTSCARFQEAFNSPYQRRCNIKSWVYTDFKYKFLNFLIRLLWDFSPLETWLKSCHESFRTPFRFATSSSRLLKFKRDSSWSNYAGIFHKRWPRAPTSSLLVHSCPLSAGELETSRRNRLNANDCCQ